MCTTYTLGLNVIHRNLLYDYQVFLFAFSILTFYLGLGHLAT